MVFAQAPGKPAPAHVPDELFWGHGYEEFALEGDDPYLAISRLHEGPGMVWSPNVQFGEPGWLVTRHAYVQEVFGDCRKILNPFFAPARIRELDGSVKQACESLIAGFEDRGSCEFISEFGEMFPSHVFLDLMGMPKEKLPDFLEWERGMLRESDPVKRGQAMLAVLEYMEDFVQEQKKNPTTQLLKGMVTARYNDERPLDDGELLGMCFLFYIGGLDTVYSVLGWIFRYLAGDQALQERLRANPDDLPRAIEEFLRAFGVAAPTRRARTDYVFHGVQMKAGDLVKPSTPAAGRDPRVYENPHKIDIDRNARHVSFATGPHICLGMHLARREIRTVLEAFLSRFRNIRIPEGETCQYHTGGVFGIDRLPLAWDRI